MKKVCVVTGAGGVLCSSFAEEMAKQVVEATKNYHEKKVEDSSFLSMVKKKWSKTKGQQIFKSASVGVKEGSFNMLQTCLFVNSHPLCLVYTSSFMKVVLHPLVTSSV